MVNLSLNKVYWMENNINIDKNKRNLTNIFKLLEKYYGNRNWSSYHE